MPADVPPKPDSSANWTVDVGDSPPENAAASKSADAPPSLEQILEAMLFVGGSPVTRERAAGAVRGLSEAQFQEAIAHLQKDFRRQGRPYSIVSHEHGYRLALRPRFQSVVERLSGQIREARLSPAAIDVLSLVAYRQPVSKQEIDSVRGAESGSLLRQLVRRGLIAVSQRTEAGKREVSYSTTPRFLEWFKLSSLDDLPQTQDLQRM